MNHSLEAVLRAHALRYPLMEPVDAVKLVYQHTMGGGHLVRDQEESLKRLQAELAQVTQEETMLAEPLGNGLARMRLAALPAAGLSPQTANRLFVLSANDAQGSMEALKEALKALRAACTDGIFGFDTARLDAYLEGYIRAGCPAPGHSVAYRQAYHPAYRVVRTEYLQAVPVMAAMDQCMARQGCVRVAIDGRSAAGKSTLGRLLARVYDANLFHMDDYFLRPEQRTEERYAEPGGNVDRERFAQEILAGLDSGRAFTYRPFDCASGQLGPAVAAEPKPVAVVEGSYSLHPALRGGYDVKVFLDIDPQLQSRRILARNGAQMHRRFMAQWVPLEEAYFSALSIREACDFILGPEGEPTAEP